MRAETLGLIPDDYAHWSRIGAEDWVNGRTDSAMTIGSWSAYVFGFMDAARRAMASKEAAATNSDPYLTIQRQMVEIAHLQNALQAKESAAPTTQQLFDAWVAAHKALRTHVQSTLPLGCDVVVDDGRYNGPGKVTYYPRHSQPKKVAVTLPNGNEWYFLVTDVRRVE